jgi:hypothetical protein
MLDFNWGVFWAVLAALAVARIGTVVLDILMNEVL